MSAKLNLYKALKDRLINETFVKKPALFNSQFANLERENAFSMPAAFIEFAELQYTTKAFGVQTCEAVIRLHIAASSLKSDDEAIFSLLEDVNAAVQGFSGDFFTPFARISEAQDIDHDVLNVWLCEYATTFSDYSGDKRGDLVEKTVTNIDINKKSTQDVTAPRLLIK